jgi:uncharacterized protein RhaS with RHS repeats
MEGRFISRDPIGFAGGDVNVYRYVGNGPIFWADPYGLFEMNGVRDYLSRRGRENGQMIQAVVERGARQLPEEMAQSVGYETFIAPIDFLRKTKKAISERRAQYEDCPDSDGYEKWKRIDDGYGYADAFVDSNGFYVTKPLSVDKVMERFDRIEFKRTRNGTIAKYMW